jgi:hypothetical protein
MCEILLGQEGVREPVHARWFAFSSKRACLQRIDWRAGEPVLSFISQGASKLSALALICQSGLLTRDARVAAAQSIMHTVKLSDRNHNNALRNRT